MKYFDNTDIKNLNHFKLLDVSKFLKSNDYYYRFMTYININLYKENEIKLWKNKEELNYLQLMNTILEEGIERTWCHLT